MKKEIGKRIQAIRLDMGMTKEAFARHIGVTGQYLGLIENGRNYLSTEKLKALCDFTDTTADYILFGKKQNIVNDTAGMLSEFTDEQINDICKILKDIALFIKAK